MKAGVCLAVFLSLLFTLASALAVPLGMAVEFANSSMGPVVFSGDVHAAQKLDCTRCHPQIFQQKAGSSRITLADHQEGESFCFSCHNGKIAFNSTDQCQRCHQTSR